MMMALYEPAAPLAGPPAARSCQPGMVRLRDWILATWPGTTALGCWADRPITGTTSVASLHRDGRAIDIGTASTAQAAAITEMLVQHADPLQVQLVLDYRGGRRWRLPRTVDDRSAGWGPWRTPGAHLHIERLIAGAADPTPIDQLLGAPPPPPPPPPREDHAAMLETLAPGMSGPLVRLVQDVLGQHWPRPGGRPLVVDGVFGAQTAELVKLAQRANKLSESGVVDLPTWRVVIALANRATS